MSKENSLRNFSYVGLARISGIALQAIFFLIFASLLGPEKYGELSVVVALAATFSIASRFGMNLSLQVYQAKQKFEISNQIKTLFVISTSIAALILLSIDPIAAFLMVSLSFFIMNQQNLLGLSKYKKFMAFTILKSGLFFIIPFLLYFVLDLPGIVIGMSIANFVASAPFFKNLKIVSFSGLRIYKKTLIQNFLVDVSNFVYSVDKLLISFLFGFFTVGIYQFNLQIFFGLTVLPQILISYLISEEAKGVTHGKINVLAIITSVLVTAAAILLIPFFVSEFFPDYSEGIFSLQILVVTLIPSTISAIMVSKLIAKESTKIGFVSIANLFIILGLIIILGQNYGLVGLSLAVLFSTIIYTVFVYWLYRKYHAISSTV